MKNTGAVFEETAVKLDDGQLQDTDQHCEKLSSDCFRIDGRDISLPMPVEDASMMMNAFLVDARVAQEMIADSGFRVAELFPGKAIVQLLCVDYRINPLGNYNEGAIIFPVITPGERKPLPFFGTMMRMARGQLANYVYRMPVNQAFTSHAGRFIWGFPKWQADVEFEFGEQQAQGSFHDEGELVYQIHAKTGGNSTAKPQRVPSLAIRAGRASRTYGITSGNGLTFALGGQIPKIGDNHPLAKQLRQLGLPKKPMFSVSIKHTEMLFEGAETVDIGEPFKPT